MDKLVLQILRRQDPDQKHTILTRIVISLIIVFASCVLYGFYGLMGSVVFYLVGVELAGLKLGWMFLPLVVMLVFGLWKSFGLLSDYWRNYGHG